MSFATVCDTYSYLMHSIKYLKLTQTYICFDMNCSGIARVNSLKTRLETKEVFAKPDWEQSVNKKYNEKSLMRRDSMRQLNQE